MPTGTEQRLHEIHSMLQTGHLSVRIERHTLILWGVTAALLVLFVNDLFTESRLPVRWQKIVAENLFIGTTLLAVGVWDYQLTRRKRQQRSESLSFIQQQITKIWWLLIALIVVINIGTNFFGGDHLFYGIAIVLTGLAIYINGLFSRQPLDRAGILLMVIGLTLLAASLPRTAQEWITASVFGIGLPALALLIDRPAPTRTTYSQLGFTMLWLAAVLLPAAAANQWVTRVAVPTGLTVDLDHYLQRNDTRTGEWVVSLPAGTEMPVQLKLSGEAIQPIDERGPSVRLSQPVDMVFVDGQPDGRFRINGGKWRLRQLHSRVRLWRLSPVIEDGTTLGIDLRARLVQTNW